jgi:hypothetical protein
MKNPQTAPRESLCESSWPPRTHLCRSRRWRTAARAACTRRTMAFRPEMAFLASKGVRPGDRSTRTLIHCGARGGAWRGERGLRCHTGCDVAPAEGTAVVMRRAGLAEAAAVEGVLSRMDRDSLQHTVCSVYATGATKALIRRRVTAGDNILTLQRVRWTSRDARGLKQMLQSSSSSWPPPPCPVPKAASAAGAAAGVWGAGELSTGPAAPPGASSVISRLEGVRGGVDGSDMVACPIRTRW